MARRSRSIILLSGGLDSTVSAAIAVRRTAVQYAFTFDYGQRAARMEIQASKKISRHLKIQHKVIMIPYFREFESLALIRTRHGANPRKFLSVKNVWVPNRNGLFINIAACYAEHYDADLIITGFNRDEAQHFPDNTPQFIAAANHALMYSVRRRVKVRSYVSDLNKKQIYKTGLRYHAPLEFIYSCYLGGKEMCGMCSSCKKLLSCFE